MKTIFYTSYDDKRHGPSPPSGTLVFIGYIADSYKCWEDSEFIYHPLRGVGEWCVSEWETIPPDTLWGAREKELVFFTYVLSSNLDFRNTPLEHLYGRDTSIPWEGPRKAFIPFKEPHPQGYQGVWASLEVWPKMMRKIISVYDTFSPDHVLEMGWDVR